jgi:hypothetical protein
MEDNCFNDDDFFYIDKILDLTLLMTMKAKNQIIWKKNCLIFGIQ